MEAVAKDDFRGSLDRFEVDARISYPSYKSFDEFIDVERLRSLDGYLTERIKRHIKTQKEDYFINYYHRRERLRLLRLAVRDPVPTQPH